MVSLIYLYIFSIYLFMTSTTEYLFNLFRSVDVVVKEFLTVEKKKPSKTTAFPECRISTLWSIIFVYYL